jgi:hypothetical protein
MNVVYWLYGSNRAMINLLKIRWRESLTWETKQEFGDNIKIRPVNFSMEYRHMLGSMHSFMTKGYVAISQQHEKLFISLRTAYAGEYSLDKKETSDDDSLDGLRLSLKGFKIN